MISVTEREVKPLLNIPKKKRDIVVESIKFKITAKIEEVMVKFSTDK